jgi:hypothetical protein
MIADWQERLSTKAWTQRGTLRPSGLKGRERTASSGRSAIVKRHQLSTTRTRLGRLTIDVLTMTVIKPDGIEVLGASGSRHRAGDLNTDSVTTTGTS